MSNKIQNTFTVSEINQLIQGKKEEREILLYEAAIKSLNLSDDRIIQYTEMITKIHELTREITRIENTLYLEL